jgi:hypothetical protein
LIATPDATRGRDTAGWAVFGESENGSLRDNNIGQGLKQAAEKDRICG